MKTREFGQTGVHIPILGQGTWMMERNPKESIRALWRGCELGLTHIDTAELYGSGKVESLLSQVIQACREEIFLVSKVLPSHSSYEKTIIACERSLQRLKTDYLNLYLLHWPGTIPFAETYRAFEKLKKDGKILHCGVSNFDLEDMKKAVEIAGASNIACNQILYHLKERTIEWSILPWCLERNIPVVGYSPFGQDAFPNPTSPQGKVLTEMAAKHKATPRQIALQFLTRYEGTFTIPKASRIEHVEENAEADNIKLSPEDFEDIEKAFPKGKERSLPML